MIRLFLLSASVFLISGCSKIIKILPFLCLMLFASGCAKTMGIYSDDFGCPQTETGECVPVEEAHKSAVQESQAAAKRGEVVISNFQPDPAEEAAFIGEGQGSLQVLMADYDACMRKKGNCSKERERITEFYRGAETRGRAMELHKVDLQQRTTQIAAMQAISTGEGTHTVPIRQPDTIMEVHILPYQTNFGALVSERTIWVVVSQGDWTWTTTQPKSSGIRGRLGATQ